MAAWDMGGFRLRFLAMLTLRGRTQTEVAHRLGVASATVSRWGRNEENVPSLHVIAALAAYFRVSPCWLGFGCKHCVPPEVAALTAEVRRGRRRGGRDEG